METLNINYTERNEKAANLLRLVCGTDVKILASDSARPNFIIGKKCLVCRCVENYLILLDSYNGNEIYKVNLDEPATERTVRAVSNWYAHTTHKQLYVVRVHWLGAIMYLTGFQKTGPMNELKPVFSEAEPKLYFNYDKATSSALKFSTDAFSLFVE